MTDRLDVDHDLPDQLRDALRAESRAAGALYNALQDLDDAAFETRFGAAHDDFRGALDGTDAAFAIAVLGLAVSDDPGDPVGDAALLSVHEPTGDGSVERLLFAGAADRTPDTVVALPVRPGDCPPGSGERASDLSLAGFREIVAAMAYKRFDLLQNDLDAYRDAYVRPTVRGLEAYARENDL